MVLRVACGLGVLAGISVGVFRDNPLGGSVCPCLDYGGPGGGYVRVGIAVRLIPVIILDSPGNGSTNHRLACHLTP